MTTLELARNVIPALLSRIDLDNLPLPVSIDFDSPKLKVNWMLQDDLEGSRAVFRSFVAWGWSPEPPFGGAIMAESDVLTVMLWVHPAAIQTTITSTEPEEQG